MDTYVHTLKHLCTCSPSMTAMQHLYAHFCVSLSTFCNRAPPDPKVMLSVLQPASFMAARMAFTLS